MPVIPPKFLLDSLSLSTFFHLDRDLLQGLKAFGFIERVTYICVLGQTGVQELEHVRAQAFQVCLSWILLVEVEILNH